MYERIIIFPYKMASHSARSLQAGLRSKFEGKVLCVFPNGRYHPRKTDLIINWGNSLDLDWMVATNILNSSEAVSRASNKLYTFNILDLYNIPTPAFTTNPDVALSWVALGRRVLARKQLHGHSGAGIEECTVTDIPKAPLYVEYIPKIAEYRVHVFDGAVIDIQRKRKSTNGILDKCIRSHANGWVFTRNYADLPRSEAGICVTAVDALSLDFGAVDLIVDKQNKHFVLEVNTAPGLEGTTIDLYTTAILQRFYNND